VLQPSNLGTRYNNFEPASSSVTKALTQAAAHYQDPKVLLDVSDEGLGRGWDG
jgi:pyridoxal biosynthesis lyase PdxS